MPSSAGPGNAWAAARPEPPRWRRASRLVITALVALLSLPGAAGAGAVGQLVVHDAPRPVPPLSFTDQDGTRHSLADHQGQVVVLNIWASWCLPCLEEMPALDALQAAMGGHGVQVLPLTVDRTGVLAARRVFAKRHITALPLLAAKGVEVVHALREEALPLTVVLDRSGREVARLRGAAAWNEGPYRAFVERLAAQ